MARLGTMRVAIIGSFLFFTQSAMSQVHTYGVLGHDRGADLGAARVTPEQNDENWILPAAGGAVALWLLSANGGSSSDATLLTASEPSTRNPPSNVQGGSTAIFILNHGNGPVVVPPGYGKGNNPGAGHRGDKDGAQPPASGGGVSALGPAVAPEPGSLALFLGGGLPFLAYLRRRR